MDTSHREAAYSGWSHPQVMRLSSQRRNCCRPNSADCTPVGTIWLIRSTQGNLFPFALNASPNAVSLPPPAGLTWHSPQAFPVSAANFGVASAGREVIKHTVPAIKIPATVPMTINRALSLVFTFIAVSRLSMSLGRSLQATVNAFKCSLATVSI
jgi:hypothetical protein